MAQILIAEDEDAFRLLVERILKGSGHDVRGVHDGDAATACLRTFPAQVVIVDLFMPGKEGIETILEIKRSYPAIKIIAMSGGATTSGLCFLTMAKKLGASLTLSKPFSADELLDAVSQVSQSGNAPKEPGLPAGIGRNAPSF